MPSVVVFGGTGFIGGAVCRRLRDGATWAPMPVGRRGFDEALTRWLPMADAVVNAVPDLAASARVAGAAARRGLPVVHLSSMAVYGAAEGVVAENAPLAPHTRYGRAKLAAEHAMAAARATILRPGVVYGPGGAAWTARIARLLQARRLGDLGSGGDGFCNLVHVDDVAAATARALRSGCAGQAFNLAVPDPPRWNDYLVRFARLLGATPVVRVSGRRLALEARLLAAPRRLAGMTDAITPALVALFAQTIILDARKAAQQLDFQTIPLAMGLADAASACRP